MLLVNVLFLDNLTVVDVCNESKRPPHDYSQTQLLVLFFGLLASSCFGLNSLSLRSGERQLDS